jgi:hypothetical protein
MTMKIWLAKFKISTALDQNKSPRGDSPGARPQAEEIRRFEASVRALDARLRAARPPTAAPADLHASIMRAVRAAEKPPGRPFALAALRWMTVPAAAALVLALWWAMNRPPAIPEPAHAPPLVAAGAALEQSRQWTERAPRVALAPLSDELEFLRRDVNSAVDFLLASMP